MTTHTTLGALLAALLSLAGTSVVPGSSPEAPAAITWVECDAHRQLPTWRREALRYLEEPSMWTTQAIRDLAEVEAPEAFERIAELARCSKDAAVATVAVLALPAYGPRGLEVVAEIARTSECEDVRKLALEQLQEQGGGDSAPNA